MCEPSPPEGREGLGGTARRTPRPFKKRLPPPTHKHTACPTSSNANSGEHVREEVGEAVLTCRKGKFRSSQVPSLCTLSIVLHMPSRCLQLFSRHGALIDVRTKVQHLHGLMLRTSSRPEAAGRTGSLRGPTSSAKPNQEKNPRGGRPRGPP